MPNSAYSAYFDVIIVGPYRKHYLCISFIFYIYIYKYLGCIYKYTDIFSIYTEISMNNLLLCCFIHSAFNFAIKLLQC